MRWNGLPVVIFGTGGTSKDVLYIIEEINDLNKFNIFELLGFVDSNKTKIGETVTKGYEVVTCDDEFPYFAKSHKTLGVFIPMGIPKVKRNIFEKIRDVGNIVFPNLIHPNVTFDRHTVSFGFGNIISPGANLTHDIIIGNFNLINNNSTVGHDCKMGDYNVVNPCATISGNVIIKNGCLIGTGANILQQLSLGNNITVGAGAVVSKDIEDNKVVVGIPARELEKQ